MQAPTFQTCIINSTISIYTNNTFSKNNISWKKVISFKNIFLKTPVHYYYNVSNVDNN